MHEIQNYFWPKDFFGGIVKVPYTKNNHNLFQGPPNPGFGSVKVQTETFLKKDSRDFENSFYLGLLESKIRRCPSLGVNNCKKTSVKWMLT